MIDAWLQSIPPLLVYILAGGLVGIESLGIPIPGETILIASALLSSRHELNVHWEWIAAAASIGAVVGDTIGYTLGRKFGQRLFDWLGRKFPRHFGPDHVNYAEHIFSRWGLYAVFFGRWVALLRIFAGPIAGALKMPYPKFLAANALGGITWATATTAAVYYLGVVAETWLSRFSYIGLGVALVGGLIVGLLVKKKMNRLVEEHARKTRQREASPQH